MSRKGIDLQKIKYCYKHYGQKQTIVLPYPFDYFIAEKYHVLVVYQVSESRNIQPLL